MRPASSARTRRYSMRKTAGGCDANSPMTTIHDVNRLAPELFARDLQVQERLCRSATTRAAARSSWR
jgi:hypothetical protein